MPRPESRSAWSARVCGAVLAPCVALAPLSARAEPPAPTVLQEAEDKAKVGDDESAMQALSEVIALDTSNVKAYQLRADVAGRLAAKYGPGAAFHAIRANDLEHVLALSPNPAQDGETMRELRTAHADATKAARQEQRRRKLLPAAMGLGVIGTGMTVASTVLLVLANTNVGNDETVHVMNVYSGSFLGVGVALVVTAVAFGVTARKQYSRDERARALFEPRYARRGIPQFGGGGLVLRF
ncbi:hypothetical protein [Nannocystis sp. SCPEA4]|uniref:hypothetical protein n=1 Tax=Nannocystis sp. SCPEA4 TaxID=2996787 RepID=UPI00226DE287|nr:hypothetical protein [Nannocystis sp. SCPEA4]MCY1060321.1 hypothetical protein [Nannocystis sp. SCPEA4]